MDWKTLSTDQLEERLARTQTLRSKLDAAALEILEELDSRQVPTADGARSLSEWVAARMDVGSDHARRLVRVLRSTESRPHLRAALAAGDATLDRVEALARIPEDVGLRRESDIAGLRHEAAMQTRITGDDEYRTADDRFLVSQPSLDESWWKIWGGLDGPSGALFHKTLTQRADDIPELPDGSRGSAGWRRATALVELCQSDRPKPAQVTVLVDATEAVVSDGQARVVLEAGPRVGRHALEAILCNATTEVVAKTESGRYMEYGRKARTAPPALARVVLLRDHNLCAADGCTSRYRLEAHHIIPWSQGGETVAENLITLCWFHHHVVIHEKGFDIYRHPDHERVRFRDPNRPRPGPAP